MTEPRWDDLDAAQADGLACVICTRDLLHHPMPRVPVGCSVTGSQVLACVGSCAGRAALPAWRLRIPDEAWTAAGLIVAAELRHLATHHQPRTDPRLSYAQRRHREGIEWVCAALTERALELDPVGGAR